MMQDALSAITYIPPFCLRLLHTAHPSWLSDCRWLVWLYAAHGVRTGATVPAVACCGPALPIDTEQSPTWVAQLTTVTGF